MALASVHHFAFSLGTGGLLVLVAACSSATSQGSDREPPAPANSVASTNSRDDAGTRVPVPHVDAALLTPASPTGSEDDAFVDLHELDPTLLLDMRYATTRNFVGKVIYPSANCLLRAPVARALLRVQERLRADKLQVLIWDCYRPFSVQERFWQLLPDPRYVAKPERKAGRPFKGSKHNRGAALDLSLADREGKFLKMPTDHDDFSEQAHRDARGVPLAAKQNAAFLDAAMRAEGFEGIATEWWHYDYENWQRYPLSERPLSSR